MTTTVETHSNSTNNKKSQENEQKDHNNNQIFIFRVQTLAGGGSQCGAAPQGAGAAAPPGCLDALAWDFQVGGKEERFGRAKLDIIDIVRLRVCLLLKLLLLLLPRLFLFFLLCLLVTTVGIKTKARAAEAIPCPRGARSPTRGRQSKTHFAAVTQHFRRLRH